MNIVPTGLAAISPQFGEFANFANQFADLISNRQTWTQNEIYDLQKGISDFRDRSARLPPREKSAYIREVIGYVSESWRLRAQLPASLDNNEEFELRMRQVRRVLRAWDAMLVCSDLAVGNIWHDLRERTIKAKTDQLIADKVVSASEALEPYKYPTPEELDILRDWRMQALCKEPLYFDERVQLVELTLYRREPNLVQADTFAAPVSASLKTGRAKATETAEGDTNSDETDSNGGRRIRVIHCLAAKDVPAEPAASGKRRTRGKSAESASPSSDRSALFEAATNRYLKELLAYVGKYGTTIDLDGHLEREPRYPENLVRGAARQDEVDWSARPQATRPRNLELDYNPVRVARELQMNKRNLDQVYVESVANAYKERMSSGAAVVHLMEGIDERFDAGGENIGTTAHMFIVFDQPGNVQPATSELIQHLKQLLLRFCAHYGTIEARKAQYRVHDQSLRESRRRREAQDERNALRRRAQDVQKQILALQTAAEELNKMIDENQRVGSYIRWLRAIDGLFKSDNEDFVLPGTDMRVTGNHNRWNRDQLAAALWTFARPPKKLEGSHTPTSLWDTLFVLLDEDDIVKNLSLHLLYRFGLFDALKTRLPESELAQTFKYFKIFRRQQTDQVSGLGQNDSGVGEGGDEDISRINRFGLREILFLMGRKCFNDDAPIEIRNTSQSGEFYDPSAGSFSFPNQRMLESLLSFVNAIDKGSSDQDVRENLKGNKIESESSIRFGIHADEPSRGFSGRGVRAKLCRNFSITDETGKTRHNPLAKSWSPNADFPTGTEFGILELAIRQKELLSVRGRSFGHDIEALLDCKRENFRRLLDKVTTRSSGGGPMRESSKNETSGGLLKALGSNIEYTLRSEGKHDPDGPTMKTRLRELTSIQKSLELGQIEDVLFWTSILDDEEKENPEEWMGVHSFLPAPDLGSNADTDPMRIAQCLVNPRLDLFLLQIRPADLMFDFTTQ